MSEVDEGPFDFGPEGARAAALCVHGLSGTPYEVRSVAAELATRGIRARGIALPGHLTTPDDLARTSWAAWLECVRDETAQLRRTHEFVFLVGMSLGGLLCLRTAQLDPVDGLVSIGAPLDLGAPLRLGVPFIKHVYPMMSKRRGSDIRDPAARARHPGYKLMPLAAVEQLIRLQGEVIAHLHELSAPTLVAHGAHDRTANPRDAQRIHDAISSELKELLILPDSGHVVPVDHDWETLAERASTFLGTLAAGALGSGSSVDSLPD